MHRMYVYNTCGVNCVSLCDLQNYKLKMSISQKLGNKYHEYGNFVLIHSVD